MARRGLGWGREKGEPERAGKSGEE
uniref:Uncharacterized protein n=1 Tax=Arundo donax TaxID=35708 RepID=A0A0A9FN81_ARUDO